MHLDDIIRKHNGSWKFGPVHADFGKLGNLVMTLNDEHGDAVVTISLNTPDNDALFNVSSFVDRELPVHIAFHDDHIKVSSPGEYVMIDNFSIPYKQGTLRIGVH